MKKTLLAVALGLTCLAAHAGTVQFSVDHAQLNNGYPSANEQHLSVQTAATSQDQLSVYLDHLNDWGQTATLGTVSDTHAFTNDLSVTAQFGGSDQGTIAAQYQGGLMVNAKVLPQRNLVLGLGLDHLKMRTGDKADSFTTQAVYYVPGLPLALQGDAVYQRANSSRGGMRYVLAATYGQVGQWTAGLSASTGRVNYNLVQYPGAIADYNSTTIQANARYWMSKTWGLVANASRVHNTYYTRNSLGVGVFANF